MRLSDLLAYLKWIPSLMLSILAICFPSRRILWNISVFENNLNSFCLACFVAYHMNQFYWAMDRVVCKIWFCALWCTLETDIVVTYCEVFSKTIFPYYDEWILRKGNIVLLSPFSISYRKYFTYFLFALLEEKAHTRCINLYILRKLLKFFLQVSKPHWKERQKWNW